MNINALLDKYGRFGLDAATAATTVSFAVAKAATKMGVRLTLSPFCDLTPVLNHALLSTGLSRS